MYVYIYISLQQPYEVDIIINRNNYYTHSTDEKIQTQNN